MMPDIGNVYMFFLLLKQENLANAKVSMQQPWYTSRLSLHLKWHSCKMQSGTKFRESLIIITVQGR